MNILEHNTALDAVEALIDRHQISGLLNLIAEICSAKADHIRENWQDEQLAASWDKQAGRFLGYANKTVL